ncbi:MAG: hypothetical protein GY858_09220 [Candidatus Omnitrophica bacterium]|nr:hypothetical protein [Candidatus Omnitrophota bacterium]
MIRRIITIFIVLPLVIGVFAEVPKGVDLPLSHPLRRGKVASSREPAEVAKYNPASRKEPITTESTANAKITTKADRISLDLRGISVIDLFRLLSVKTGLTIVPSKKVTGRVNLFLNNVTFDDALDVILITQGLAGEKRGDILMIMTANEYKMRYGKEYDEKRELINITLKYAKPSAVFAVISQIKSDIGKIIVDEASATLILLDIPEKIKVMKKTIRQLDRPLDTQVFDLRYANVADIKEHLNSASTKGTGEIYVDERTSRVVVSDLPRRMDKIGVIVDAFDKDTQEVFIEAEIIQISLKKEHQRGIDWQKAFTAADNLDFTGTFPVSPSFSPSVSLDNSSLNMSMGTLEADKYNFVLNFLNTFGDVKVLSRPRIAVTNNDEARIMVGSREAYVTQTQSQGETTVTSESVEFIDVGIKLNVIPSINADNFITLKIKPEISSVRDTLTTAIGSEIPIIETSEAETVVKVKDGAMIMIAGLMKHEKRDDSSETPFFAKIPFLGSLFRSQASLDKKTELIIFISPKIISGESAIPDADVVDHIPADIFPKDMKNRIFQDEINKIAGASSLTTSNNSTQKQSKRRENIAESTIPQLKGAKEY